MTWVDIVAGAVFVVSPLNMRYQFIKLRRRVVETDGDVDRFDRFLHSRLLRALYVFLPLAGSALIVLGLLGA